MKPPVVEVTDGDQQVGEAGALESKTETLAMNSEPVTTRPTGSGKRLP